MSLVVFKLGGSLLECPDWPRRLRSLWESRPRNETRLVVVGGGRAADLVREWDRRFALGETRAHDVALAALFATEALVAALFPELRRIDSVERAASLLTPDTTGLICARAFLDAEESSDRPVPRHWEFTTDSIAAWIARRLSADELVLLKSADPTPVPTLPELQRAGLIDREFHRHCRGIPTISWINLLLSTESTLIPTGEPRGVSTES